MSAMKDRKDAFPEGIRRALAVVAVSAVAIAGWQITTGPHLGIGAFGMPGATADPTGPPGPTGGMTDGGGSQFQPPGMPSAMPDYQGGNQPPLNQNNGISIYNTGTQGAPQQGGQQGAQAQQEAQQPAHGTQMPDYQTATPYTQGPGHENPNYQPSQQVQQPQQQQPQHQPSQEPTQQPSQNDQQDQQREQQCEQQAEDYGTLPEFESMTLSAAGSAGSLFKKPSRKFTPASECALCPKGQQKPQSKEGLCDWASIFCKTVTGTAQPDPSQLTQTPTLTPTTTKPPEDPCNPGPAAAPTLSPKATEFVSNFKTAGTLADPYRNDIIAQAIKYGIPPEVIAGQIHWENGAGQTGKWDPFNFTGFSDDVPKMLPSGKISNDDGRGLTQFISATWGRTVDPTGGTGIMQNCPVTDRAVPSTDPDVVKKDPRTNPYLSIQAQGQYDNQNHLAAPDGTTYNGQHWDAMRTMLDAYNSGSVSPDGIASAETENDYSNNVLKTVKMFQNDPSVYPQFADPESLK